MGLFSNSEPDDQPSATPVNVLSSQPSVICTGLSGNEIYCLGMSGYSPGNMIVGNCVYAIGALGSLGASIHSEFGGEISQYTNMIAEGRKSALQKLEAELQQDNALGAAGVTSEVIFHPGNIEFLSIGSGLHAANGSTSQNYMTSSADGQELYCQIDAGFLPMRLAFGNVAYSIGLAGNLLGRLRQLGHGEISEYSNIFTITREAALKRICADAAAHGANAVVGIRTTIVPIGTKGVQEMMMLGTSTQHPALANLAQQVGGVITSDLTGQEMWNVLRMGYAPMELVLGTSVYSLGVMGGIKAALRSIAKGEVNSLTEMVYGAREESLKKVQDQAAAIGADMVIGTKTYLYQLGSDLIEFLAIGTAVKRIDGVAPRSPQLPPQAIINDRATFIDTSQQGFGADISHQDGGASINSAAPSPGSTVQR